MPSDTRGYFLPHSTSLLARGSRVALRLGRAIFRAIDDVVYVRDLGRPLPQAIAPRGGEPYVCRPLDPADRSLLAGVFGNDKAETLIARLVAARGVIAVKGGKVAGYSWMTSAVRAEEGEAPFLYRVAPPKGWTYGFDTYVLPENRGLGVAAGLKILQMQMAQADGSKFFYVTHDRLNHSVIRLSERLGFAPKGVLKFRRVLGLRRVDLSALPDGKEPV